MKGEMTETKRGDATKYEIRYRKGNKYVRGRKILLTSVSHGLKVYEGLYFPLVSNNLIIYTTVIKLIDNSRQKRRDHTLMKEMKYKRILK